MARSLLRLTRILGIFLLETHTEVKTDLLCELTGSSISCDRDSNSIFSFSGDLSGQVSFFDSNF